MLLNIGREMLIVGISPKAAEFFITKNGLVGFTVNVVYASPIFDFGLGLADL